MGVDFLPKNTRAVDAEELLTESRWKDTVEDTEDARIGH